MNNIQKTLEALTEALDKKQKQWLKDKLKDFDWKDMHSDWFGGKYRIYLPLKEVKFNIVPPPDIQDYIEKKGYVITDYVGNKAKKKDSNQEMRIGKILNDNPTLVQKYKEHKDNTTKDKNLLLCISRFPYDYAGQSTDRNWTSCKQFWNINYKFMADEIKEGWMIGYIIRENDKTLKRPLGRILAVPYVNGSKIHYKAMEESCYGVKFEDAIKVFQNWLDKHQGSIDYESDEASEYNFDSQGYQDSYPSTLDGKDLTEYFFEKIKELKNISVDYDDDDGVSVVVKFDEMDQEYWMGMGISEIVNNKAWRKNIVDNEIGEFDDDEAYFHEAMSKIFDDLVKAGKTAEETYSEKLLNIILREMKKVYRSRADEKIKEFKENVKDFIKNNDIEGDNIYYDFFSNSKECKEFYEDLLQEEWEILINENFEQAIRDELASRIANLKIDYDIEIDSASLIPYINLKNTYYIFDSKYQVEEVVYDIKKIRNMLESRVSFDKEELYDIFVDINYYTPNLYYIKTFFNLKMK